MKRLLLLKAREKYLKNTPDTGVENTEMETGPQPVTEPNSNEGKVVPRSPKRRLTGDRALLERLSALSSQRSSTRSSIGNTLSSIRSSKSNSSYNCLDSVGEVFPLPVAKNGEHTPVEIYNVLRKLHDSIDQLESEDLDPNQPDHRHTIGAEPVIRRDAEVVRKHRQSDPLLPEERTIIEGLLMKYNHLEGGANNNLNNNNMIEPLQKQEEKIMFSSKVKIRGASPHHSRKTSMDDNKPNSPVARTSSVSTNNSNLIAEEVGNASGDFSSSRSSLEISKAIEVAQQEQLIRRNSLPHNNNNRDNTDTVKHTAATAINTPTTTVTTEARTPKAAPRETSKMRKISTVKEFTKRFEEKQFANGNKEPKFTIVPEQKYYHVSSESSSESDSCSDSGSSSGSDYEDTIVKTNEGFIIPDEAITKMSFNKIAKAQRLREEQEEIERQFKKENFLKDLPARRGIRMPVGSAGKVNQLKSKFEGTLIGE